MDVDTESEQFTYTRNSEDVQEIIKDAKLNRRNLLPIVQTIHYPQDNEVKGEFKLLELDKNLLETIKNCGELKFKGSLHEPVVLCTENKTYEVKEAEISNSLMLIPEVKFFKDINVSVGNNTSVNDSCSSDKSLNDSNEDCNDDSEDVEELILKRKDVLKIFHEYMECKEIQPRFRKLFDLLNMTRYCGEENEHLIDRSLLYTRKQLEDTIQCSTNQLTDGLNNIKAMEINNYIRILENDYEYRIINLMVGLINENSWNLDEIEKNETINALGGIAPEVIVKNLFELYTIPSENHPGKYKYRENLVAILVAKNILLSGLKFHLNEFLNTWQEALPEGMIAKEEYLRGLGIIERDCATPYIKSLDETLLSTNIHERLSSLFAMKNKWTLEEIEPYIEYFRTPSCTVNMLLSKHTRSASVNNRRYFFAKH